MRTLRRWTIACMLAVFGMGMMVGCDNTGPGDKTDRNIDNAMEDVEKRLEEVSEEIEEDAEEN
ncbi:hypothetical protein F0A17_13155 [Billgrantia pellis]|uniref:YtxH domain-containing protein n=1 Tax=Billgrantia pellis TaxID=2606936 RepID=A0A7V7KI94_9GAMM|nr:hypothetical protein [Halomonas pellis]KAA0012221.1 hypothetical protein F0A17_13155 [Halomonas pellis]